jgi:hypothetical protein
MQTTTLAFPPEAYRKLREEQSMKARIAGLEALANKIRGNSGGSPESTAKRERFPRPPAPRVIFSHGPPYTGGSPNPELTVRELASEPNVINVEGFGDPRRGLLSVGIFGGNLDESAYGGTFQKTTFPLPDRWYFGDAISTSASVFQAGEVRQNSREPLIGEAEIAWDAMPHLQEPTLQQYLDDCLNYDPGAASSALEGFVGFSASIEVAVTLFAGTQIIATDSNVESILTLTVNAYKTGEGDYVMNNQYLMREWAFEPDVTRTIYVAASVPFDDRADQVVVEAAVHLIGARGGVSDPNAGWLQANFIALGEGATPLVGQAMAAPFAVRKLSASLL